MARSKGSKKNSGFGSWALLYCTDRTIQALTIRHSLHFASFEAFRHVTCRVILQSLLVLSFVGPCISLWTSFSQTTKCRSMGLKPAQVVSGLKTKTPQAPNSEPLGTLQNHASNQNRLQTRAQSANSRAIEESRTMPPKAAGSRDEDSARPLNPIVTINLQPKTRKPPVHPNSDYPEHPQIHLLLASRKL